MIWFKKKSKDIDNKEEISSDIEDVSAEDAEAGDVEPKEVVKDGVADVGGGDGASQGWLSRLTGGLAKSTSKITQGLGDFVTKRKLDDDALEELEDVLIAADLGPHTAAALIEEFARERFGKDVDDQEIKEALALQVEALLEPVAGRLQIEALDDGPYVVLVCGVNGAGKTTTIGKIAERLMRDEGKSVMVAAGDTFRAAAVEQLRAWADRSGAQFYGKNTGADAAAVAYEAYQAAVDAGVDVLLIDTAGRLQNKTNLMDELQKIVRVLRKSNEDLPHQSVLVLDATTGQNAFSQVQTFGEMIDIDGLIVTKLDGSAKGGVLVGLAERFEKPVYAIGVGEKIDDLRAFDARDYARALMGVSDS